MPWPFAQAVDEEETAIESPNSYNLRSNRNLQPPGSTSASRRGRGSRHNSPQVSPSVFGASLADEAFSFPQNPPVSPSVASASNFETLNQVEVKMDKKPHAKF